MGRAMDRASRESMTVLHVRADQAIYGAERVILTLAKEQRRRGLDAQVACVERPGVTAFYDRLRDEGIPAHRLESRGKVDGAAVSRLKRLIDDEVRPGIIHSHSYKTDTTLALLSPFLRRRAGLVATNHLWTNESTRLRFYEIIDALALRAFDRVVAVSEEIKHEMEARGVPEDKLAVVQNGLDYDELKVGQSQGKLRAALKTSAPDSLFVGYIGRLSPQKGLPYLIGAAARLAGRRNVYFVLIGEGELRAELEQQVRAQALDERVVFLGRRDDVPDLLQELDMVVLPSVREGTPMVLLEAMGVGRAVVASAVGGVRDVIEHGRTGLVVEPTDVPGLAQAITRLVDDPAERRALGRAAYAAVRDRFSSVAMARRYDQIYREAGGWRMEPTRLAGALR
jgi:glycosyltransferase involved in cell wall biosynthesis